VSTYLRAGKGVFRLRLGESMEGNHRFVVDKRPLLLSKLNFGCVGG
jgi:hypothetical protein